MGTLSLWLILAACACGQDRLPAVTDAEVQPLLTQTDRLVETLEYLGAPLSENSLKRLAEARESSEDAEVRSIIQQVLDPLCLAGVTINPESRVKVTSGPAPRELDQNGWRVFLVKVHNQAGVTAPLRANSPQAKPIAGSQPAEVRNRWLDLEVFNNRPLPKTLSGIRLEYRPVLLYSRDPGKRTAIIAFDVGQGTQDIGFRNDISLTFDCRAASELELELVDEHGEPTVASLEITDPQGRVYPSQAKRIAPDFHFQRQVYRRDGEQLELPLGKYTVRCSRGPEYLPQTKQVEVTPGGARIRFALKRWIDPSKFGWWSGDHHIHAAGCAHYANPTQGVHAPDMYLHCRGEDLKIGANLTWGPCFDYQKQFFTGEVHPISSYPYLLRYDVEVSGFGSHQSGHLCLLRLSRQIPPGGDSTEHWPTLCLNTLKWAQKQGAVCGPAHSGWGLEVESDQLPNYEIPPFNGIGANEYIVDVTHMVPGPGNSKVRAVDFMSMCDTPYPWELNIWYHTLNCGFRTRISGETDFPCIYGERVGLGRSYVKLDGKLDYDQWCEGVSRGACYVSDGKSHLMDFRVNGVELGNEASEVQLEAPGKIQVSVDAAALLAEKPNAIGDRHFAQKPYWHIERARLGDSRQVPVELVINGRPVAQKNLLANGTITTVDFETMIDRSSWVAVRVLGSSHTNPIFVVVDGAPIYPSRKSARWCLESVDQCWSQKKRFIREAEMADAVKAYEHAKATYRKILDQALPD